MSLIRRLGSRGWLKIEEGGLVRVNCIEVTTAYGTILFGLPWFDGMTVGGCIAKGLDEVVVLGDVTGKHCGGTLER